MREITKKYTNGEVTVVWKPGMCIHSAVCFNGLPRVFDPRNRPWVNIGGADTKRIIEQIKQCPSGALSYFMNSPVLLNDSGSIITEPVIEITQNGPLLVHGNIKIKSSSGGILETNGATALCRCGSSLNKPFCDGHHKINGFEG